MSAQRAAEERAELAERWEHTRALARYLVAKDGLEVIAAKFGRADARRIAELAGQGDSRLLVIWDAEEEKAEAARQPARNRARLRPPEPRWREVLRDLRHPLLMLQVPQNRVASQPPPLAARDRRSA